MYIHIDPESRLAKLIIVFGSPRFVAFLWFQVQGFYRAYESNKWPEADGEIILSKVERKFDLNGPRSTAIVRCSYSANEKDLRNDTTAFGLFRGMLTCGYADKKVSIFPKGKATKVYYDPTQPEVLA